MQLHTLMGTKAGVHVHLYVFVYGSRVGCVEVYILRYTMNNYVSLCTMTHRTLDIPYVGLYGYLDIGLV